jgi:hypothetical protein
MNRNNTKDTKEIKLKKNQQDKDNYIKPDITYTEKLSKVQVRQLLYDYEEIKNIKELEKIELGTHIRYFEDKDGEMKFRTGGILTVNTGFPDYLILSNGKISWSVQIKKCIFFKRLTIKELRDEYEKELIKLQAENKGLQSMLQSISAEKEALGIKYNKLIKKIESKK